MRLALAFLLIMGIGLKCEAAVANEIEKDERFEICRSDDPQKCKGELFVPCNIEAGSLAMANCQKKGWTFFTLTKVKEVPGGQCGSTIYGVRCQ